MAEFEKMETKLRKESDAHNTVADSLKFEGQTWNFILICLTFGTTLLTIFGEHISSAWYSTLIKVYTMALVPLATAVSMWRAAPQNEATNRKLATAKRDIADTITAEMLRPSELREQPDDFYEKIKTMIEITDKLSF